jgi:hypothetical protein
VPAFFTRTGATGPDAFGQRTLRVELDLQFPGQVLLHERLVLADIGTDHPADLARLQQHTQPDAVDAGIVGNHRQVAHAGFPDRLDQRTGNTAQPEATGHDGHAVMQQPRQRRGRVRKHLLYGHRSLPFLAPNPG